MSQKRHSIAPQQMELASELMTKVSEVYLDLPESEDIKSEEFKGWHDSAIKATRDLKGANLSETLKRLFRHNLDNHFHAIHLAFEFLKMDKKDYCKDVEDFRKMVKARVAYVAYELEALDFWVKGRGLPAVVKGGLGEFMEEMRPILLEVADERGMEIEINAPEKELLVWIHRGTIASLLTNQIKNAKAHGRANRVTLGIKEEDDFAKLLFADNGNGVPREHLSRMFNFGYSSSGNGSSGIGLANADRRMEDMGGNISCDPNGGIGGGALFEMAVRKA